MKSLRNMPTDSRKRKEIRHGALGYSTILMTDLRKCLKLKARAT